MEKTRIGVYIFLLCSFIAYGAVWWSVRSVQAVWTNVPPVPPAQAGRSLMLGDAEIAYRVAGLMLQNLGDTGGRSTALQDYDYNRLGQWFMRMDSWDSRSNFMPLLAAYYYGATPDSDDLRPVIDYLALVGKREEGEKWRWLAQAIFLARYKLNDMDLALRLANDLAAMKGEDMPAWTRQMPAFIELAKGDKEAAYDIMMQILKSEIDRLSPDEIYFMKDYICTRVLNERQAAQNPLCVDLATQAPPQQEGKE